MSTNKALTAAQCRAARALLDWSQQDLAVRCKLSGASVAHFERGTRNLHQNHIDLIRSVLEEAGVEFIPSNGGGPGVRLRDPTE